MNKSITEHYRQIITRTDLPIWEVEEALFAAIRSDDAELVRACKDKGLPLSEDEWEKLDRKMYPTMFALREMANIPTIEALIDIGFSIPEHPEITPFSGTSEEIVTFLMKAKGIDRSEAVKDHVLSTNYYLEVFSDDYSCFRVPFTMNPENIFEPGFFSYLSNWLIDFIFFCMREKDNSKDRNIYPAISTCAEHEELFGALEAIIESGILDEEAIGHCMNWAINGDNEMAFDCLLEVATEKSLEKIRYYPVKNINLLKKMFSRNILIPGTEKAYEAFLYFISHDYMDYENEELLKAITHPSYMGRRNKNGQTHLMLAVNRNKEFYFHACFTIVNDKEELNARDDYGRSALYYVARYCPLECIEPLIEAGADPYEVDDEGNTVLHVLVNNRLYYYHDGFKEEIKFLPKDIIDKRNKAGKSPFDLFLEP